MNTTSRSTISSDLLLSELSRAESYPHAVDQPVEVCETHISWVFLAGDYAYKVKKPVKTSFLDYSSLQRRAHFCREELRLDRRFAPSLYLDVVPITLSADRLTVEGDGETVEYAVKMHRFPADAVLGHRLSEGIFPPRQVFELAHVVAEFHQRAGRAPRDSHWGAPETVLQDARDNLRDLSSIDLQEETETIESLKAWTEQYFREHECLVAQRVANGFIRECHGDLHLANVIDWRGEVMPFDGIEFNDRFRWIDVLSDAAFLAMDFGARGHLEYSHSFINAYVERTGDHASLPLLRWYLVFRSLVRAKVDAIRFGQQEGEDALRECQHHVRLAHRFSLPVEPKLWITHGVSGSGKTTGSERVVQKHGAIRLRSDLERKRHFGIDPWAAATHTDDKLYTETASVATYGRLRHLAHRILQGGYPVVVDATFLNRHHRESFRSLADTLGVSFEILDFNADPETLEARIVERMANGNDVSDADLSVLQSQLKTRDPLTSREQRFVAPLPEVDSQPALPPQHSSNGTERS